MKTLALYSELGLLAAGAALVLVACGGSAADVVEGSAQDLTSATRVTGAKAERLIAALGGLDAVDHAMGGRSSVDVSNVKCTTVAHTALDVTDPLFNVPITTCALDVDGATPAHHEVADTPGPARVIFDAVAAASDAFVDSGMGHTWATLKSVSCEGDGPGAGAQTPAATVVTCSLTGENGKVVRLDGEKAMRLAQGFGLASVLEHAMGGDFGIISDDLACERSNNTALDESSPAFGIPSHTCAMKVSGLDPAEVAIDDTAATSFKLQKALETAGLEADSAMGQTVVTSPRITCRKGPSEPASCVASR
jgi:hypothetical protein